MNLKLIGYPGKVAKSAAENLSGNDVEKALAEVVQRILSGFPDKEIVQLAVHDSEEHVSLNISRLGKLA